MNAIPDQTRPNVLASPSPKASPSQPRFVVHEHRARNAHYDFRLEMDGALRSWAVPKGPPPEPRVRRLAVQVEDHPISYIDFEGEIPAGRYGAGTVRIWDRGTYTPLKTEPGELKFELRGEKLRGQYALVRFADRERGWLFLKLLPRPSGAGQI